MPDPENLPAWNCPSCQKRNRAGLVHCLVCGQYHPAREAAMLARGSQTTSAGGCQPPTPDADEELVGDLLHAADVTKHGEENARDRVRALLADLRPAPSSGGGGEQSKSPAPELDASPSAQAGLGGGERVTLVALNHGNGEWSWVSDESWGPKGRTECPMPTGKHYFVRVGDRVTLPKEGEALRAALDDALRADMPVDPVSRVVLAVKRPGTEVQVRTEVAGLLREFAEALAVRVSTSPAPSPETLPEDVQTVDSLTFRCREAARSVWEHECGSATEVRQYLDGWLREPFVSATLPEDCTGYLVERHGRLARGHEGRCPVHPEAYPPLDEPVSREGGDEHGE